MSVPEDRRNEDRRYEDQRNEGRQPEDDGRRQDEPCEERRLQVHRLADGELSDSESAELQEQLASCAETAGYYDELGDTLALLQEIAQTERRAEPADSIPAKPTVVSAQTWRLTPLATSIAAVLILCVTLVWVWQLESPTQPEEAPESRVAPVKTASIEIEDLQASGAWAVQLPSETPRVHVFWVYGDQKGTSQ